MMNERIEQIIDRYCEGKKYIFAEKCGVTPQTCSVWFKNGFNNDAIDKIRRAFPQVSIKWIETGEGTIEELTQEEIVEAATNTEISTLKEQIEELKAIVAEKDRQINALLTTLADKL